MLMKKLQTYDEFLNESYSLLDVPMKAISKTVSQIEQLATEHGKTASDIKDLFDDNFMPEFKKAISVFKPKEKLMISKLFKSLDGNSLASSISDLVSKAKKYKIQESVMLSEKVNWGKIAAMSGKLLKKGAKLTWDKAILPLLKYLINLLARLLINLAFAIVNAVFSTTYSAPAVTIFKKKETDGNFSNEYEGLALT
jgi:hypothetical protein